MASAEWKNHKVKVNQRLYITPILHLPGKCKFEQSSQLCMFNLKDYFYICHHMKEKTILITFLGLHSIQKLQRAA